MQKKINVAVVGATGLVGGKLLEILAARNFPVNKLHCLVSERSVGKVVRYGSRGVVSESLASFDFTKVALVFFTTDAAISKCHVPRALASGCWVIDNSSAFRGDDDVPLIIPEINAAHLAQYGAAEKRLIANPNCSTIQMLMALSPIHQTVGIQQIIVATYQSVSGSGRAAVAELIEQSGQLLNGLATTATVYPHQIAINILPQVDNFSDNGFSKEELKMVSETHKILGDLDIQIIPTAARVPVLYGHSEAINIQMAEQLSAQSARELLAATPGLMVIDDLASSSYPMACVHGVDTDEVYVGRIRNAIDDWRQLSLWVVADNLRKGGALNSVQIAELLLRFYNIN